MEETRISRMYLNLLTRALGRGGAAVWRSPLAWIAVVLLALVGVGVAVHQKGAAAPGDQKLEPGVPQSAVNSAVNSGGDAETPRPGGQEPMVLARSQHPEALFPEFLSATLLPGRGMNVLQITAFLPGKGIVPLLSAPSLAEAASRMTGTGDDGNGQASLTEGAAIEVPWAGRLTGASVPGGLSLATSWHGRSFAVPANGAGVQGTGVAFADGGLLLRRGANAAAPSVMPDGGVAEASFEAGDFSGHWVSNTVVKTTVVLSARTMDLTITARNTGTEPEPMGIGWRPRFALPGGNRAQVRLRLPSTARAEAKDARSGLPSGHVVPVEGTAFDFSKLDGAALGDLSLNELYVLLKSGPLASGPEVEVRDPAANYGMRVTALTPSIKALRVVAPAGAGYVSIDPQTNYDDPWGRVWSKEQDTGMVVLQPNQSLEWKVRLEIFALNNPGGATVPHLTSPGQ